jgi:hypothetical protein
MRSLQSLQSDHHRVIAAQLAKEASTVTAYLPSMRAWGSTNKYFRKVLLDAGWLAPADACKFKMEQAILFDCPALRVLNVADRFAHVLPLDAFELSMTKFGMNEACPNNTALPMLLLNRASARLQPKTKSALLKLASQSSYALPLGDGEGKERDKQDWQFTIDECENLVRFIADCFGVSEAKYRHTQIEKGVRYFAEDCLAVIHRLPAGLKARAFHELANSFDNLMVAADKGAKNATLEIQFDIEHLIPVQWNKRLFDKTAFPCHSFGFGLLQVLTSASKIPDTKAAICNRLVQLVGSFLDAVPIGSRHWTQLESKFSKAEIHLLKNLLNVLHTNIQHSKLGRFYVTLIVRNGLITKQEINTPKALKEFDAWCSIGLDENNFQNLLRLFK